MNHMHDLNQRYPVTITKTLLTALFAGMIATVLCMIYNIVYRDETRFPLSDLINVSSLIFVVNIFFLLIGVVYYGLVKAMRKGELVFIALFVLLTVVLAWRALYVHRSDDPVLNQEFHNLLLGVVVIMGVFASLGIPLLYHSKKFQEGVL